MWIVIGLIALCLLIFMFKFFYKEKAFFKEGYQFLEEGVLFLDNHGKILSFNQNLSKIWGLRNVDFKNKNFFEMEQDEKKELLEQCQQLLMRLGVVGADLRETFFYKKEEESFVMNIIAIQLSKNKRMLILKDIDQEQREFSLGKEFISNASHELRTPITIIKGFVETLKDLPEISDAMLEDIFEKILRSCKRMDNIVKNLLILTDLDHLFSIQITAFDAMSFLDNTRYHLLEMNPEAQVEIVSSYDEVMIEADMPLLELAIMNLLQNAVKYSTPPAKIKLILDFLDKETIISIVDQGFGIPKESVPYIFERFYSVNKTMSRRLGGAGLGLSIVKKIIDKHQGTISVESNPLGGTIFKIHLPQSNRN